MQNAQLYFLKRLMISSSYQVLFLNSKTYRNFLGNTCKKSARRSTFFFHVGGSWKRIGPSFSFRYLTFSKNRLIVSSGSFNFFWWVINRLALTTNRKSSGLSFRQFLKVS